MSYVMRSARCWLSPAVTPNPNGKIVWFELVIGVILPAGNGIDESLLSRAFIGSVRRDPAFTMTLRGRATRADSRTGRPGKSKKHFRVASEPVVSALKICFFIQAVLAMPALAQTPLSKTAHSPHKPNRCTVSRYQCRKRYSVLSTNSGTRTGPL